MNKEENNHTTYGYQPSSTPKKFKNMCPAPSKHSLSRKRNDLTIARKLKIIEEFTNGVPISVILKKFNINQSHLSSIIRRKAAILQDFHTYGRNSRKRIAKRTRYGPINEEVYKWLISLNCHVSGSIIQNKAKAFAEKLKIPGFRASNGWLECFRKKYNVHSFRDFQTSSFDSSQNTANTPLDPDSMMDSPHLQRQRFGDPNNNFLTVTTATDDGNNLNPANVFSLTSTSHDSLVSPSMVKSSPNYNQRPILPPTASGSNIDPFGYPAAAYHRSTPQAMSPSMMNAPISSNMSSNMSPNMSASISSNINSNIMAGPSGSGGYKMESAITREISSSLGQQAPPSLLQYRSGSTENMPMHYSHAKPLRQPNLSGAHDIYGYQHTYAPNPNPNQMVYTKPYADNFSQHNFNRYNQNPSSNEVNSNVRDCYDNANKLFFPLDQAPPTNNNFNPSTMSHMKHVMNDFSDMTPNSTATMGNPGQEAPTMPMHGNFHTPNFGPTSNWNNARLANLTPYSMYPSDNVPPNPSNYYPRTNGPNDNSPHVPYPYGHTTRNPPTSFHPNQPNQPKDFY